MRRVPVLFLAGGGQPERLQGGLANCPQTWHMATTVVASYNNLNCWSSRCSSARRAPSWPGCCETRWPACSWPSWPSALVWALSRERMTWKQKFWNIHVWSDVLAFYTADQLYLSFSYSLENSLHWTLWFSVGHLPLLFTAEWWWHIHVSFHLPAFKGGQCSWKAPREMKCQGIPENDKFFS